MSVKSPYRSILYGSRPPHFSNGHSIIWSSKSTLHTSSDSEDHQCKSIVGGSSTTDVFQAREGGGGMRVGKDYQALIPPILPINERLSQPDSEKALLVWRPTEKLSEAEINSYLKVAKDKYGYSGEQALGLLYWHHHDVNKATQDLSNFLPHSEEWTFEDKVLFEEAFQCHGKEFEKIKELLPEKPMSSIIRYYYIWKKSRSKTSSIEHQSRIDQIKVNSQKNANMCAVYDPATGAEIRTSVKNQQVVSSCPDRQDGLKCGEEDNFCCNCGIVCTQLSLMELCTTCFLYWKTNGEHRPLTGPFRKGNSMNSKRLPIRGMFINHDDLTILASTPPQSENVITQNVTKSIPSMISDVQSMKGLIETSKKNLLHPWNIEDVKELIRSKKD